MQILVISHHCFALLIDLDTNIAMLVPIYLHITTSNVVILLSAPVPVCNLVVDPHFTPVIFIVLFKVVIKVVIMYIFDHDII